MEYWTLDGLSDLYLEDSWVLNLTATPGRFQIDCDLVLRESHPDYREPRVGEQYCYRRGMIVFVAMSSLEWVSDVVVPAVDASGEVDYGSFDEFSFSNRRYELAGDFGRIVVTSDPPIVWLENA